MKTNNRAVSPVIGVVLMVAITVILAAMVGTFVLTMGDSNETAPQATLNLETGEENGEVVLSHQGGDQLNLSDIQFSADGTEDDLSVDSDGDNLSAGGNEVLAIEVDDGDKKHENEDITLTLVHEPSGSVIYSSDVTTGDDEDSE